jgi:hypothetical protein
MDWYSYDILNYDNALIGTNVTSYVAGTKTVTFTDVHNLIPRDKINFYGSTGILKGTDYVVSTPSTTSITLLNGIATLANTDLCRKPQGMKIELFPTSRETNNSCITIRYIRKAKQLVDDTDVCDIPEFENFVILFARYECLKKEIGNPLLQITKAELEAERRLMVETLTAMVPDNDNEINPDLRFYRDFYGHLQAHRGEY